jgi:hypothetical protein
LISDRHKERKLAADDGTRDVTKAAAGIDPGEQAWPFIRACDVGDGALRDGDIRFGETPDQATDGDQCERT